MKSNRACSLCKRPWRKPSQTWRRGKNCEKIRKILEQNEPFTSGIGLFRKRKRIIPAKKIVKILGASGAFCVGCGRKSVK